MEWTVGGHGKQKAYFERLMVNEHLSHAYLFAGPEGIGKHVFAEDVAQRLVPKGYELDVMRLAPVPDEETGKIKDIPIEATMKLKSWISLRPFGACKAVIIEDADRLGTEAANNLLKVLEEPPVYAHFFLVTSHVGQVLPTIASRCERVDLMSAPDAPAIPVSDDITALGAALKASVAEKLIYAKQLADHPDALGTVKRTLAYIHGQLTVRPTLAPIAHGLLDLAKVLAESHYNRRLAIEHFLLSLPVPR